MRLKEYEVKKKQSNDTFLRFRNLLRFVFENKYSDFYRLKYEKAGFNPLSDFNSLEDIKKIPFLTREELSTADPLKLLFVEEEKIDYVIGTSGTTGNPIYIFCSIPVHDISASHDSLNFGKVLMLRPTQIVYATYLAFSLILKVKANNILLGDIYNIPASLKMASALKANAIYTAPSLAIILENYLGQYPDLKKSLKFLLLTAEEVSPYKKRILQKLYPDSKILGFYGASEFTTNIAGQCAFLAQRSDRIYYHPILDIAYPEIINPATEKEVGMEKEGELVVTCFHNQATPIIRYKTEDLASFSENNCPCGYPGSLLQVLGRIKLDIVKVAGFELRKEMLEKVILNLKDYLNESFEVHFYENYIGTKPRIKTILNLSLKREVKESPELRQKIRSELLENWRLSPRLSLEKAVEVGLFEIPQINFVRFPQSTKSIRKLILH